MDGSTASEHGTTLTQMHTNMPIYAPGHTYAPTKHAHHTHTHKPRTPQTHPQTTHTTHAHPQPTHTTHAHPSAQTHGSTASDDGTTPTQMHTSSCPFIFTDTHTHPQNTHAHTHTHKDIHTSAQMDCSAASNDGTTPAGLNPNGRGAPTLAVVAGTSQFVQPAPTAATPPFRAAARQGRPWAAAT